MSYRFRSLSHKIHKTSRPWREQAFTDSQPRTHKMNNVSRRRVFLFPSFTLTLLAFLAVSTRPGWAGSVDAAWIQAEKDARWSIRAVVRGHQCPVVQSTQGLLPMQIRAPYGVVPARTNGPQKDIKPSVFDVTVCEAQIPSGWRSSLVVDGHALPTVPQVINRIVLIGDTGCRLKQSDSAFQDCNEAKAYPFAALAARASAMKPDLVVHLGDLHYRESPCPADQRGCAGSPWGYGYDAWLADVFIPGQALLSAAPWVFVRGNHESCQRAGVGWHRFFDAFPRQDHRTCEDPAWDDEGDFSEPFFVEIDSLTQLIVFDSSLAAGQSYPPGDPVARRYADQLQKAQVLANRRPKNIFLNHHPVLAFAPDRSGMPRPGNQGLGSVMSQVNPQRLLPAAVQLAINGHVHLFEVLSFHSAHPAALVVGNGGTQMDRTLHLQAARTAAPMPGARLKTLISHAEFGFSTLDRTAYGWRLTSWGIDGPHLALCDLVEMEWRCQ